MFTSPKKINRQIQKIKIIITNNLRNFLNKEIWPIKLSLNAFYIAYILHCKLGYSLFGVYVTREFKTEKHQHCILKYLFIYRKSCHYRNTQQQYLISQGFLIFSPNFVFRLNDRPSHLVTISFEQTHEQYKSKQLLKGKKTETH